MRAANGRPYGHEPFEYRSVAQGRAALDELRARIEAKP